jgi:uncharacterized membrane protein (UPF0127 family)
VIPEDFQPQPDPRVRRLSRVVAVLLVVAFGACIAKGANGPANPALPKAASGFGTYGFGEVAFRIEPAPNQLRCALLATTADQRQRGLMQVLDLKGYAGMIFSFPVDGTGGFHMRNTPMPLSIAWFRADGTFVSSTDMAPCEDRDGCLVYDALGPYRYALEVPQGQLTTLGIGPGSRLRMDAVACPGH